MAIHVQSHAKVSKETIILDGVDVGAPNWHICGCGLNRSIHVGMNNILNVKVHLKICCGNVNISEFRDFSINIYGQSSR